jgi:hypothetical protein
MVQINALLLLGSMAATPILAYAHSHSPCLDLETATKLVDTFNYFYVDMDADLARKTLTEDFSEWSDSDNSSEEDGPVC